MNTKLYYIRDCPRGGVAAFVNVACCLSDGSVSQLTLEVFASIDIPVLLFFQPYAIAAPTTAPITAVLGGNCIARAMK